MMEKATLFVLSKDGSYIETEAIDLVVETLGSSFEIVNAPHMNHLLMKAAHESGKPVRNAHNNPLYLLGEIEESEYPVIVVAWDENEEGMPRPRFFVGYEEMVALMKELEKNPDTDAWETAVRVNKEIRSKKQ